MGVVAPRCMSPAPSRTRPATDYRAARPHRAQLEESRRATPRGLLVWWGPPCYRDCEPKHPRPNRRAAEPPARPAVPPSLPFPLSSPKICQEPTEHRIRIQPLTSYYTLTTYSLPLKWSRDISSLPKAGLYNVRGLYGKVATCPCAFRFSKYCLAARILPN